MHYEPLGGLFGRYSMLTMNITEQVDVSINGERAALLDVSPSMSETDSARTRGRTASSCDTPPIHIGAGPQRVSAAFIQRFDGPVDDLIAPLENTLADVNISFGVTALPHMRDMTIVGPSAVTRRVGHAEPPHASSPAGRLSANEEETCAAEIVKKLDGAGLPRRRRPPTTCRTRSKFVPEGARRTATSRTASAWRCSRFSPARASCSALEQAPPTLVKTATAIGSATADLASRLSFFLWARVPDAELIKAATHGRTADAGRPREAGAPHARRSSARRRCRRGSPASGCGCRTSTRSSPTTCCIRSIDDTLSQAMQQRDRALLRQHRARGPQRRSTC